MSNNSFFSKNSRCNSYNLSNYKLLVVILFYFQGKKDEIDIITAVKSVFSVKDLCFDLLVVNNSPDYNIKKLFTDCFPENLVNRIFFIDNHINLGYGHGNNIGISFGEIRKYNGYYIMNPDATLEKNALYKMVNFMGTSPDIGAVSPLIMIGNTKKVWAAGGYLDNHTGKVNNYLHGKEFDHLSDEPFMVEYLTGCGILINAACIKDIGNFPEEYFLYFEDTVWSHKARQNNWRLFCYPSAIQRHFQRSTGGGDIPRSSYIYYYVRNNFLFTKTFLPDMKSKNKKEIQKFINEHRKNIKIKNKKKIKIFDRLVKKAISDAENDIVGKIDLSDFTLQEEYNEK